MAKMVVFEKFIAKNMNVITVVIYKMKGYC